MEDGTKAILGKDRHTTVNKVEACIFFRFLFPLAPLTDFLK